MGTPGRGAPPKEHADVQTGKREPQRHTILAPAQHRRGAGPGQPPGARANPVLARQPAYGSGVTRYSATPSGGTVALIFPADEMSNVVWPPTTADWLPQRSWTW